MKKSLLFICLLFITSATFAQRITYADLLFALNHNDKKVVEDKLLTKGFAFSGVNVEEYTRTPDKTYNYDNASGVVSNLVEIFINEYQGITFRVSATTSKLDEYVKYKNQIKVLGFKLESSNQENKTSSSSYVNGDLSANLSVVVNSDDTKSYFISLDSDKKYKIVSALKDKVRKER